MEARYPCGPAEVLATAETEELAAKIADVLELYNVAWLGPLQTVRLDVGIARETAELGPGAYLECQRMNVDLDGDALVGTCRSGGWCRYDPAELRWTVSVPDRPGDIWVLTDMESVLSLVVTTTWREQGWVPVHAGAVTKNGSCALLCAESGGGKTSMTAAMVRRGWRTLGDDKLLLRIREDGTPELRSLVHTFNLHPATREWFPEVGDLERLPVYSEWTEKRKVSPQSIWPGSTVDCGSPTHLVQIHRVDEATGVRVTPLADDETMSTLLHQTVVPKDRGFAGMILGTVIKTAGRLDGIRVEVGEGAYHDESCLDALSEALS